MNKKEYMKLYNQKNKDKIKQYNKEYHKNGGKKEIPKPPVKIIFFDIFH